MSSEDKTKEGTRVLIIPRRTIIIWVVCFIVLVADAILFYRHLHSN